MPRVVRDASGRVVATARTSAAAHRASRRAGAVGATVAEARACGTCLLPEGPGPRELRPYGPGGALICHGCATATPAAEATGVAGELFRVAKGRLGEIEHSRHLTEAGRKFAERNRVGGAPIEGYAVRAKKTGRYMVYRLETRTRQYWDYMTNTTWPIEEEREFIDWTLDPHKASLYETEVDATNAGRGLFFGGFFGGFDVVSVASHDYRQVARDLREGFQQRSLRPVFP